MVQGNFREQVSRFTRARNFNGGAYVLVTALENEDFIRTEVKGDADSIVRGICAAIDLELLSLDDESAVIARERIKQAIIVDEQRRFNASEEVQPCRTDRTNHVGIRDVPRS